MMNTRSLRGRLISFVRTFHNYKPLNGQQSNKISKEVLKVSILGAMGEVGQPLSLMLRQSEWFSEVALYDLTNTRGLGMELNDIDIPCRVMSYYGHKGLVQCLKGAHIVVVCASTSEDSDTNKIFRENAMIVAELARHTATHCPNACFCLVTSPVNCLLPIACEIYKKVKRCVDPRRMFGVTSLDVMRVSCMVAEVLHMSPEAVLVPVIGGHSRETTVPVISHTRPCIDLNHNEIKIITECILRDADDVTYNKDVIGRASLAAAWSTSRFVINLAKGLLGHPNIAECAYVMSNIVPNTQYFASQVLLGPNGISQNYGLPQLSNYECCLLENALPHLQYDICKGEAFVGDLAQVGSI